MLVVVLVVVAEADTPAEALGLAIGLVELTVEALAELILEEVAFAEDEVVEARVAELGFATTGCSIINLASLVTTELLKGIIFFNRIG